MDETLIFSAVASLFTLAFAYSIDCSLKNQFTFFKKQSLFFNEQFSFLKKLAIFFN